jgi:hypothetical protein
LDDPFEPFRQLFADNPWIWAVLAGGLIVWIAALTLVVRSPKFRRKWLWAVLTLLSFSFFSWEIAPGESFGLSLPIGAAYVIGFWLWGPRPTAEALALDVERREAQLPRAQIYEGRKLLIVRVAYVVAALAAGVVGWLVASGSLIRAMASLSDGASRDPYMPQSFVTLAQVAGGLGVIVIVALFLWMAIKPRWWGKLLCVWAGLGWMMFGAVSGAMTTLVASPAKLDVSILAVLGCGVVMLAVAVVHQTVDSRLFGWSPRPR